MTPDETAARIAELEAKLAARDGQPGYKRNAEAIRAELGRLRVQEARRENR